MVNRYRYLAMAEYLCKYLDSIQRGRRYLCGQAAARLLGAGLVVVKVDWPRPAQPALSLGCVISGDEVTHCWIQGYRDTGAGILETGYWIQGYRDTGYRDTGY